MRLCFILQCHLTQQLQNTRYDTCFCSNLDMQMFRGRKLSHEHTECISIPNTLISYQLRPRHKIAVSGILLFSALTFNTAGNSPLSECLLESTVMLYILSPLAPLLCMLYKCRSATPHITMKVAPCQPPRQMTVAASMPMKKG